MCLLIVLSRVHPELPLVVAANRDEFLERAAVPMAVLREASPRVVGGRDERGGGTWLAVNERGVVAGLTNAPSGVDGATADPSKRSRGELPVALASHDDAPTAVERFGARFRPQDYNPAWILVGDRAGLFLVDMTAGDAPRVAVLPPGVHIVENRAPGTETPKVRHVRALLGDVSTLPAPALTDRLRTVLADHEIPAAAAVERGSTSEELSATLRAACVHTDAYGTRWSAVVTAGGDATTPPEISYTDGPACVGTYEDASSFWS